MSQPELLLIAYHFPPSNAVGGARLFRFYKYLSLLGYHCHVLTAARQQNEDPDIAYVPDTARDQREGFWWQAERWTARFALHSELALGWSRRASEAGLSFLGTRPGRRIPILSSGPPVGTHFAARRLARQSGMPWIADFRDPINSVAGERAPLQGIVAPFLERRVLKQANLVLANTGPMRDTWVGRYPRLQEKIHVCWNGFDPEDVVNRYALPARERKILSHVGELYGGRDLRPVLDTLQRLFDTGRLPNSAILVRQIGNVDEAWLPTKEFLNTAAAQGWLEFKAEVPAAAARSLAQESDGLILVQPHTNVQVPGKLFEYVRLGRPILAFVMPDTPIEAILQRSGIPHVCLYPNMTEAAMDASILQFLTLLDGRPSEPSTWFLENFDARHQAAALDRLIQPLMAESSKA